MSEPSVGQIVDDPKKPFKAVVASLLTAVALFVYEFIADEGAFTGDDAKSAILGALLASGLVGGGTFVTRNPKTSRLVRRH